MPNLPQVTIGILVYKGEKYFDMLFSSLLTQGYKNIEILVLDNASPTHDIHILEKKWGENAQIFRSEKNLGFAGGHNMLIQKMKGEFYLCLNQDVFCESDFVEKLIKTIEQDPQIGAVCGKIYGWNVHRKEKEKTKIIDSVGVGASASHSFYDIGQGELDTGKFDTTKEVFAASGAAVLYRKSALDDVAIFNDQNRLSIPQYFDEIFFMYKEDIDLGYRLRWAGWKTVYTPTAICYHDRTISRKKMGLYHALLERIEKPEHIRAWSFLNQQILLKKNFSSGFSWAVKWRTFGHQFLQHIFVFIFEPSVFFYARKQLKKQKQQILEYKQKLKRKVLAKELEKFFI